MLQQKGNRPIVSTRGRDVQRGFLALVDCSDISTRVHKQLHNARMSFQCCFKEWGPSQIISCVHICPTRKKFLDN
jgi:hypothetical protein